MEKKKKEKKKINNKTKLIIGFSIFILFGILLFLNAFTYCNIIMSPGYCKGGGTTCANAFCDESKCSKPDKNGKIKCKECYQIKTYGTLEEAKAKEKKSFTCTYSVDNNGE